ncbi:sulfur carrier protein ThiS [Roseovarius sp. LXJ103]|uniref:sulfur carrier protein ThiS n=1 Tax=Roseovarius carneus TaxID=2853164 RepID=UPI000D61FAEA|nr:sulfur carrier protein ThiS [Roseovarius carneus]MBZ8118310.1 sulfur carrier protein ThiS [Roseovarius carneus]PWE35970.1 thiamine biosynthesis protein ThiS [Pelagicola sp. LXJ1103]
MKIELNGAPRETSATTLDVLLSEAGYDGAVVATARNGDFVPRSVRADEALSEGDRIEILAPMKGG